MPERKCPAVVKPSVEAFRRKPSCGFQKSFKLLLSVGGCSEDVDRACVPGIDLSGVPDEHLAPCGENHVPWRAVADEPGH